MKKEIMSQAVLTMGYGPLYEGKIYANLRQEYYEL